MFDDFILDQLSSLDTTMEKLKAELMKISLEEVETQEQISGLYDTEDVGLELFSPRTSSSPLKDRVAAFQKHLEELQLKEAELNDQVAECERKKEHFQALLKETAEKKAADATAENMAVPGAPAEPSVNTEELTEILRRVEKCINLVGHDRNRCKEELKGIRFYVKALIGSLQKENTEEAAENVSRETI